MNLIFFIYDLENTDIYFITDFSIPAMRTLPETMVAENIPIKTFFLDTLIEKHRNTPQDKCPLVFAGHHGGGHGDDHGDDHGGGHRRKRAAAKGHGGGHEEEDHHYKIKDLQTEDKSFYTIAQEFPENFAKPSNVPNIRIY